MFSLFSGRENPYKECRSCTLPYIDKVNGRNGLCDFCTDKTSKTPPPTLVESSSMGLQQRNTLDEPSNHSHRRRSFRLF
jgi:hypothetical protein